MPEAPADFDDDLLPGEHDVRPAGKILPVKLIAVASTMEQASDNQLGLGVLRPYRSKVAPTRRGYVVEDRTAKALHFRHWVYTKVSRKVPNLRLFSLTGSARAPASISRCYWQRAG